LETKLLKTFRYVLGAALIAASQFAVADLAEVRISDLKLSVSSGEWWYWLPTEVNWLSPTAGTDANLTSPGLSDSATGWHGKALSSSVVDGTSLAQSAMTAKKSGDLNGVTAVASVTANDGQSGWASTKVFDGQIMVGGNATITVSANLDSIKASGSMAQANAYIELCSTDFQTDVCSPLNYTEAFVDAFSPAYTGPSVLTTSWTNPGATTWAKMHIYLTASAESVANSVPEPATFALCAIGLAGVGFSRRRRA
jgi:hypothetical protein